MKIRDKQYAQALLEIVRDKEGKELEMAIKNFARVLAAHQQIVRLDRIINCFSDLWNKEKSLTEAEIIAAHKLDAQTEKFLNEYIKKLAGAGEVISKSSLDAGILGGIIIKYGDRLLDASIRTKLRSLAQALNN
ncbi:MAG: ATP synthase F1 subunit delta [Patescibacteria group bacterium]